MIWRKSVGVDFSCHTRTFVDTSYLSTRVPGTSYMCYTGMILSF